ncbi:hypothetical protein Pan216_20970 [Planctomycetes bacterium Pan216]|uniref:Uncharacterized protein n=1 Tax=Kolteria novifilia TaxID=2527975 RepID=A0A518B2M6_9BACT|nr:hypothetical protein Pan216_20970 [Planctomycetes bacterium Pan216]
MATDDQINELAETELQNRLESGGVEEYQTQDIRFRGARLLDLDELLKRRRNRRASRARLIKPMGDK